MPRLFTALEIPADVGSALSMLRGGLPGARWIDPENYHLTLRFIGDIDDVLAREIAFMLGQVRRGGFELRLDGLSSFGGRKPRAVVAAVAPSQSVMELQAEHERLMQRVGLEPEGRKYTPHVTLARLRDASSRDVAEYLSMRGGLSLDGVCRVALRAVLVARLGGRRALCGRGGLSVGGVGSQPQIVEMIAARFVDDARGQLALEAALVEAVLDGDGGLRRAARCGPARSRRRPASRPSHRRRSGWRRRRPGRGNGRRWRGRRRETGWSGRAASDGRGSPRWRWRPETRISAPMLPPPHAGG